MHGVVPRPPAGTEEPLSTILIAEDDRRVRDSLERALGLEGYEVITATDGARVLELHASRHVDMLILDVSMPNVDGLSVCRKVRQSGDDTPVLMLTARHEIPDRVAGLDAGADDYLVKPFALEELLARIRARLRPSADGDADNLVVADLVLDPAGRRVTRGSLLLDLSRTEFELLEVLMINSGVVLSREVLYDRVWDGELEYGSKALDVYVGYLRRKIETGGLPRLLHTVRGVGYVVRDDET